MLKRINKIKDFFSDREYYSLLFRLALPIMLQGLISSSLNFVSVFMIGQLGEVSIAAVGLSNQIWFLLNLMLFGISSGSAMFVAQLWGKRDIESIRRVVGLTMKLGLTAGLLFWVIASFFPEKALGIYTEDPAVILLGARYLRIVCWSYLFFAITMVYGMSSRAVGNVKLPVAVSTSALIFNILLAYPLIFGVQRIGIPALGVEGVAIAGLIARILECLILLFFIYKDKLNPVATSLRHIVEINWAFIKSVMSPVLPVIANEVLWSLGITTYNAIYGHIGTNAVAAINIISTIDQIAFVIFLGLGNATAIMIGNLIGKGDKDRAYTYGGRTLLLQGSGAMVMGIIIILVAPLILQFYKVAPQVIDNARHLLVVLGLGMWVRASNHAIVIGILRSGGDTRFSLILDGLVIWLVGVPFTAAGAFLFHLPVYFVYALTLTEEVTKYSIGLRRYFSKKWINDLTQKVAEPGVT